ncbi:putative uncharacterized protein DDB_G0282499 [Sitodiplosis mosellana]|uniref:putative uncharacterized protein DDB_G0282499 n=1 Tax=Sitodiplosis mosellana TaxID=263140 RepID=UPI002443D556|nr:putative uncharacterized protein DDB_G0282499 [Sitodiplosis mosellana]
MNDNSIRDPNTVNCRIYVGNLKENTPKNELQAIFSKYGNIRGVMVSRNFGFVQFDSESNANNAIESENQKLYNGRKITVSKVQSKNKNNQKPMDKGNIGGGGGGLFPDTASQTTQNNSAQNSNVPEQNPNLTQANNNAGPNNNMGNNTQQIQSTENHQQRQQPWRNRNNNRNNNNNNMNEMNLQTDRERSPFDGRRDLNNERWNQDNQGHSNFNNFRISNRNNNIGHKNNFGNQINQSNNNMGGGSNSNNMGNNMNNSGNKQSFGFPNNKFKSVLNGGVLQGYASAREIRAKYPNANDCEIVVLEKHLVDYAEYVENRLKRANITCDLLFPNADLTVGKMLTNISNRGSLFAVIIQPQHKENNSVTLNILYGIPAEHRNMPLEDAISLLIRNYQQLCQGEKGDVIGDTDESPYASIPLSSLRHPDSVQHLVNLLANNRTLTVLQLDCLLKYLQERRELQYKFELGDTSFNEQKSSTADNEPVSSPIYESQQTVPVEPQQSKVNAEDEIQKKIMEILNKPSIPNIKPEATVTKPTPEKKNQATASSTDEGTMSRQEPKLLAKDPNLRNVLDSLMLDGI